MHVLVTAKSQQSDSTNKYLNFSQKELGTIPDIFVPNIISTIAFEFGGTLHHMVKNIFLPEGLITKEVIIEFTIPN